MGDIRISGVTALTPGQTVTVSGVGSKADGMYEVTGHDGDGTYVLRPTETDNSQLTLAEIDEAIGYMEQRLETGQGHVWSAMCRLSLPMTRFLRAEIARLRQRIWDEHQADEADACTCSDCRKHAKASGLWKEITDDAGRVVGFKAAHTGGKP